MASSPAETHERRKKALDAFVEARLDEGYLVETRTDTQAVITQAGRPFGWMRRKRTLIREVIAVDADGVVTITPAEPLRS
ncbi:MAG TPA: hypothetical protein VGQ38_20115 [Gaiellaceae bacterium]|nr:hypothetical protein [Gaiellaceae bacterium]